MNNHKFLVLANKVGSQRAEKSMHELIVRAMDGARIYQRVMKELTERKGDQ